jgi:hypothetical protein
MDLDRAHILIESFRKELFGAPKWQEKKEAFEYEHKSIETVVILKLIRAAQGLTALDILCKAGLSIDLGASIRGIYDAVEEVYFLLESYPDKPSNHVEQFVQNFFENTADGYLDTTTHQVARDKIRNARVRILAGRHDDATQKLLERIYKTFCGYTHASYVHIMEIYNGQEDSFNLAGIPSVRKRRQWAEHVGLSCNAVLMAAAFTAQKRGKSHYFDAMMEAAN